MSKCTESNIQEMLPDLLHSTLTAETRERVEAHLASCEECREELEVLRTVRSAAVFAPTIDVDRVVRQIPPYRTIVPAIERPATARVVSWLVAASLAVVVLGGGSLLMIRSNNSPAPKSASAPQLPTTIATSPGVIKSGPAESTIVSRTVAQPSAVPHTHELALAADVDGLSDGSLEQLINEMNQFDALPATESDPVISVDSSFNLEQD